jgi:hypothetical protein
MKARLPKTALVFLSISAIASHKSLGAQAPAATPAGALQVCSLLTDAEVNQLVARGGDASEKNETPLGGGASCTYGIGRGQIMVYSGRNAAASFNDLAKSFHIDTAPRNPVSGVGEGAYVTYPKPRDEYEVRAGLLVTKYRQYMLGISLEIDKGKPNESVQPDLIALTKVVMQKLP